jgi:hypothetical protein
LEQIVAPLVLVIMGHWSLLRSKPYSPLSLGNHMFCFPLTPSFEFSGIPIHGACDPAEGCKIASVDNRLPLPALAYSMVFDFAVLCLTGWKLALSTHGRSKLVARILRGGLVYFIIVHKHEQLFNDSEIVDIIFMVVDRFLSHLLATVDFLSLAPFNHSI